MAGRVNWSVLSRVQDTLVTIEFYAWAKLLLWPAPELVDFCEVQWKYSIHAGFVVVYTSACSWIQLRHGMQQHIANEMLKNCNNKPVFHLYIYFANILFDTVYSFANLCCADWAYLLVVRRQLHFIRFVDPTVEMWMLVSFPRLYRQTEVVRRPITLSVYLGHATPSTSWRRKNS